MNKNYKMYVVVDATVKMPTGKLAREVAGAVTYSIFYHLSYFKWASLFNWFKYGIKTIVLKTENMDKLIQDLKLCRQFYLLMVDSGLTVFNGVPTRTCLSLPIMADKDTPFPIKELKVL